MVTKYDKRDRSHQFRLRLLQAMERAGQTKSGLARATGVDRSTISQLTRSGATRLPNAHVVAECAAALGVSSDWLLGLSDAAMPAADVLEAAVEVSPASRALIDDQILDWHREAEGYKIRHVPTSLPDMLKTPALLAWEYGPSLGRTKEQAIGASADRLAFMRSMRSDYEVAIPHHEFDAFASGAGYYADCPIEVRREQVARLKELYAQLYPTLRIVIFDGHRLYSAPLSIFGPLMATIYVGRNYLAFRDRTRVQALTSHFDSLVREATVTDREIDSYLDGVSARMV